METIKKQIIGILSIFLFCGCSEKNRIEKQYSKLVEEIFHGASVVVKVSARGAGDLKVRTSDPIFYEALKGELSETSGPWSKMNELVPMLSAVSIIIEDPEKKFKRVFVIASNSLIFQDGESEFFYGRINEKVWQRIWDLAAAESRR